VITFLVSDQAVLAAVLIPFAGAALIPVFHAYPNLRETVTLTTAALLFLAVLGVLQPVLAGARPEALNLEVVPGLALAFKVEPLGVLFALIASALWIITSIYSIGYMRGNNEPRQTSYYVCFAVALGSTVAIAFAKNLFTLFLFYEALTLSTYPLVTHKANAEAMRAGRIYLMMLLGTSMVLLLPAIVATWVVAGTIDFLPGGILAGKASVWVVSVLLALYIFGIGKAAIMPLHFWLPAAMVAPTPVSALLHAVAVVKAGVFAILKVVVYVFGLDLLSQTGAATWLVYVVSVTVLAASLVALHKDNLKARLAYSTISQLAYVVLGAVVASSAGVIGAGMQIAMHAAGKITLFFCAGAIYVATHKTEVSELDGIGRSMPVTMFAFLVASLSIIGMPPLGGSWSKWFLALGALDAGYAFVVAVLMLSSVLNVAYLMSVPARAFFRPLPGQTLPQSGAIREAPLACLMALCLTAGLCVGLFFFAGDIERLIAQVLPGRG
jgi:multicomponent Na+:H+ antiporter subunit D